MTAPRGSRTLQSSRASQAPPKRSWAGARLALIGVALVVVAVAGWSLLRGAKEAPTMKTAPSPSPVAPAATARSVLDYDIPMLEGGSRRLADYKGKVVVLDLWATWCAPCRAEIPHLIEINRQYKGRGVELIGLTNENPATDAGKVRDFAREFKIDYPLGWANGEFGLGLQNGRDGIPQTFVIGRDGRLRNQFVGFNARTSPPQLRAAIEQAIAGTN